jgi:hypothetical protein
MVMLAKLCVRKSTYARYPTALISRQSHSRWGEGAMMVRERQAGSKSMDAWELGCMAVDGMSTAGIAGRLGLCPYCVVRALADSRVAVVVMRCEAERLGVGTDGEREPFANHKHHSTSDAVY